MAERAVADLGRFTDWLRVHGAKGYVGEVGWPSGADAEAWNQVAAAWFETADRERLWVTAWSAGRWWPSNYPMAVYRLTGRDEAPTANSQARVIEAHAKVTSALRGIDLPSGAFASGPEGPPSYSASDPGTYGADYYYEEAVDLQQLARTGATVVRVSVTWERLQHRLGQSLDEQEVGRLRHLLDAAQQAGLGVIVDLHGYGDYWVAAPGGHRRLTFGTSELTDADFADFWRRLSVALRGSGSVLGYGLMNEPTRLAPDVNEGVRIWESASQAAADAIRDAGDQRLLFVSGYGGASPVQWQKYHPRPWIADPTDHVRYEAHQYFDSDRTGRYRRTFAEETVRARQAGFGTDCSH